MKTNSRRNTPDAISPQNPLNKTDITSTRIQDELVEKISVEETLPNSSSAKPKEKKNRHANALDPSEESGL